MSYITFLLITSICLSLFYLNYKLFFNADTPLASHRVYLLVAMVITILLPFTPSEIFNVFGIATQLGQQINGNEYSLNQTFINEETIVVSKSFFTKEKLFTAYQLVVLLFVGRFVIQSIQLLILTLKSDKQKVDGCKLVLNNAFKSTFSIFNFIYVHHDSRSNEDFDKIIAHEKIHASQYHSLDIILIELLSAVMWFNPLVWLMRKSIINTHEFLADEGALSTGIDRLKYQALLVNQVTEERLICISSGFNQSLIKKRMIMMTKSKINQHSKLRILSIIPVVLVLLFGIACTQAETKSPNNLSIMDEIQEEISTYIVDGEEADGIDSLNPDDIYSVDVNKETRTITVISVAYQEEHLGKSNKTLFIVDGEKQDSYFSIETIDQSQIKSIDVIKNEDMVKELDDGDYSSAIIVEMKE